MKQLLHIVLLVATLLLFDITNAQNNGIRRVCLNTNDTLVTLTWSGYVNSCGTFVRAEIWGRKQSDPYSRLHTVFNQTPQELEFKVGALDQTWSFYILVIAPCLADSFFSDTISIDIIKPSVSEIDSVSIEQNTQNIIIGWSPNPASDTKGYRIYRYGGAINDSIGDTSATIYKTHVFSAIDGPELSIAAYDSCNLYAPISSPHRPVVLNLSAASDCSAEVDLSWTSYLGWGSNVDYTLLKALNSGSYIPVFQGSLLQFKDTGILYGDSVCYYVRSTNTLNSFTSSSNRTCYKRWAPKSDASFQLLNFSSDLDGTSLYLDLSSSVSGDVDSIQYTFRAPQKISGGYALRNMQDAQSDGFNYYHINSDLDPSELGTATIEAYDKCGYLLQEAQATQNVVLQINGSSLMWNPFALWETPLITEQSVLFSESGSTWNSLSTVSVDESIHGIERLEIIDRTCFRIVKSITDPDASSVHASCPFLLSNLSNIACLAGKLTYFIPTGISLGGSNNRFYVVGNGIDREASHLTVFNRWGEHIVRQNLLHPWYPAENGLMPGSYFYQVSILGFNGEKANKAGPIYIIE